MVEVGKMVVENKTGEVYIIEPGDGAVNLYKSLKQDVKKTISLHELQTEYTSYLNDLKKGDFVKVRKWKEMFNLYLYDYNYEEIKVPLIFTMEMRSLCDKVFEILEAYDKEIVLFDKERGRRVHYYISREMVKPFNVPYKKF